MKKEIARRELLKLRLNDMPYDKCQEELLNEFKKIVHQKMDWHQIIYQISSCILSYIIRLTSNYYIRINNLIPRNTNSIFQLLKCFLDALSKDYHLTIKVLSTDPNIFIGKYTVENPHYNENNTENLTINLLITDGYLYYFYSERDVEKIEQASIKEFEDTIMKLISFIDEKIRILLLRNNMSKTQKKNLLENMINQRIENEFESKPELSILSDSIKQFLKSYFNLSNIFASKIKESKINSLNICDNLETMLFNIAI